MARVFLREEDFEVVPITLPEEMAGLFTGNSYLINPSGRSERDAIKRELYEVLAALTGARPEWGTLTGVRPLKPALQHYRACGSLPETKKIMMERYLLSEEKAALLNEILCYQCDHVDPPNAELLSLYIGIPFCPTKCTYCAFGSDPAEPGAIELYLDCLLREIAAAGALFRQSGKRVESVYYGGGTPTTLCGEQLTRLFSATEAAFGIKLSEVETTVEAGRPDTIDRERLTAIRRHGVRRISINPQSMKEQTLQRIGRSHSPAEIEDAFTLAKECGIEIINSDIIVGLPGESIRDLEHTLQTLLALGANNITVHTLSVKRGSKLRDEDPEYHLREAEEVPEMLARAGEIFRREGFLPYYIYRQKHQMGARENIGWCRPGTHALYNIRIMEEEQTVIGLGAGAIGKRYHEKDHRLERVPNVSGHRLYAQRIDEMIERKKQYFGGQHGN